MDEGEQIEETLPLDLTGEQAAVLCILCSRSIKTYNDLKLVIKDELKLPLEKRSEQLGDNTLANHLTELSMLLENTQYIFTEAGKVVVELDKGDGQPNLIQRPNFGKY